MRQGASAGFCTTALRFDWIHIESRGIDLAREAARNYRIFRGRGHTVRKTIDCLIARFCLREQHSLVHRDPDFDSFEEFLQLAVVHPSLRAQRMTGLLLQEAVSASRLDPALFFVHEFLPE